MRLHLVDGTYELFRAHYGAPPATAPDGRPVGAVRGLMQTLLALLRQDDVTHVACAFDTVIESFRNELFDGYKTGEGVPEELEAQFGPAERAAAALGVVVWPMVEFEADDAIATAAARWGGEPEVDQVVICSPDKDMTQLVTGDRVVCLDRRRNITLDEAGVRDKFGVDPESIPDYLALVGDSADGIPGVPRWGAKSTALMLARYSHIENIPRGYQRLGREAQGRPRYGRQPAGARRRGAALPPSGDPPPRRPAARVTRGPGVARGAAGRVRGVLRRVRSRRSPGRAARVGGGLTPRRVSCAKTGAGEAVHPSIHPDEASGYSGGTAGMAPGPQTAAVSGKEQRE